MAPHEQLRDAQPNRYATGTSEQSQPDRVYLEASQSLAHCRRPGCSRVLQLREHAGSHRPLQGLRSLPGACVRARHRPPYRLPYLHHARQALHIPAGGRRSVPCKPVLRRIRNGRDCTPVLSREAPGRNPPGGNRCAVACREPDLLVTVTHRGGLHAACALPVRDANGSAAMGGYPQGPLPASHRVPGGARDDEPPHKWIAPPGHRTVRTALRQGPTARLETAGEVRSALFARSPAISIHPHPSLDEPSPELRRCIKPAQFPEAGHRTAVPGEDVGFRPCGATRATEAVRDGLTRPVPPRVPRPRTPRCGVRAPTPPVSDGLSSHSVHRTTLLRSGV